MLHGVARAAIALVIGRLLIAVNVLVVVIIGLVIVIVHAGRGADDLEGRTRGLVGVEVLAEFGHRIGVNGSHGQTELTNRH